MHPVVFSCDWFDKHQDKLLWLLNHWMTRRWFRWVLCIRRHDIGYNKPICELRPDGYVVHIGGDEFALDCRTHHKYAKRLYYAFEPAWWVMHFLDWLCLDRCAPEFSFGFATLTVFPDPGNGSGTTTDFNALRISDGSTWSSLQTGNGTALLTNTTLIGPSTTSSAGTDTFNRIIRTIMSFNTSVSGTVSAGTLSVFSGSSKDTALGSPDHHIAGALMTSSNSATTSDYQNCSFTSFGSVSAGSWTLSAYNDHTLNASGIAQINSSGVSQFSSQLSWDINNSFTGTWAASVVSSFSFSSGDETGTANDPKLVITYSIAGRTSNNSYQPSWNGSLIRQRAFAPGRAR